MKIFFQKIPEKSFGFMLTIQQISCIMIARKGKTMNLHYYQSKSGKNLILEYIDSLPTDEQIDGYSVLKCLEDGKIEEVRFKRWEKKVYEVYFYKHNRIFYVTIDDDNMYFLHACRKQKNKTEKKDKKIVETRAKELGKELGKSFI